jgi:hypothetical protein
LKLYIKKLKHMVQFLQFLDLKSLQKLKMTRPVKRKSSGSLKNMDKRDKSFLKNYGESHPINEIE